MVPLLCSFLRSASSLSTYHHSLTTISCQYAFSYFLFDFCGKPKKHPVAPDSPKAPGRPRHFQKSRRRAAPAFFICTKKFRGFISMYGKRLWMHLLASTGVHIARMNLNLARLSIPLQVHIQFSGSQSLEAARQTITRATAPNAALPLAKILYTGSTDEKATPDDRNRYPRESFWSISHPLMLI